MLKVKQTITKQKKQLNDQRFHKMVVYTLGRRHKFHARDPGNRTSVGENMKKEKKEDENLRQ